MTNISHFPNTPAANAAAAPAASAPWTNAALPPAADFRPPEGVYPFIGNPLDQLAPAARAKFEALKLEADELHVLLRLASDAKMQQVEVFQDLQSKLAHQKAGSQRYWNVAEIARLEAAMDAARAEQAQREARYQQRAAAWQAKNRIVTALTEFLKQAGASLRDAAPVDLPASKAPLPEQLEAQRQKITALKVDRQGVKDAPKPSGVAKQNAREVIEALAKRGEPNPMIMLETNVVFQFVGEYVEQGLQRDKNVDLLGTLAWLMRDEMIAKVEALIDDAADDASAMSDQEKRARIAALDQEIIAGERVEERLVEACLDTGFKVERRADCSPLAILGLEK